MNSRRSTPSGDGRGQGRGGAPRGGSPRGGDNSRGGSRSGGSRGGSQGGFRSDGPRRDDRGGFRAERDGSRSRFGRPAEGGPRSDAPRRDDRGGSQGGFRSDGPRRDDRGGFRSDAPRRDDRGSQGGFRSDGPRRDDRGSQGGFRSDGPRRDDRGGSRGGFRSDAPRRDDRGSQGGFRSDGPRRDDRGGFRAERDGSRSRFGRPAEGGPRSDAPRRDDRGGFRSDAPRRDDRGSQGGFRSDGPRRDDRGGFRSDGPRRDDRGSQGGFRSDGPRRDDRGGSRGRFGADRGRADAPGAGSRSRFGRAGRADEVQTIGGKRAGSYGERRTVADRGPAKAERRPGAIDNDRFKTARQPKRDSDFYDRDYVDERDTTEVPDGVRLQKVLAQAGVASRRACEDMIGDGRVTVDGQVVRRFGARVDPAKQVIHVDGKRLPTMPDLVYLAINKPIGVVSTMSDPDGRPSLADFVADRTERLFHVGRLDTETEGLILLTNDGELANRLTHPSYGVQKKYWAKVPGRIERDLGRRLKKGIELEDGIAKADSFTLVQEHGQQALVEVVLHEGRKHIVRRMLEEVGHPVIDLARIEFGPVKLGRLKPGTVRALTVKEVGELYAAVGL
ncbi:23S rRNA pseudouridine2605 synthase [Streptosporangium canum]|uniref:Pseudouridine synthase n=1 Tax=Streptosporangium canum TaxID=324952 RepID=A0A1I3N9S7_9ACTN|nr:pseudouridine synthase [Streptosporangium canum]SFJ06063.1 23S rRNA pseudouridine2605 synthase [Streptosporangium canum]